MMTTTFRFIQPSSKAGGIIWKIPEHHYTFNDDIVYRMGCIYSATYQQKIIYPSFSRTKRGRKLAARMVDALKKGVMRSIYCVYNGLMYENMFGHECVYVCG